MRDAALHRDHLRPAGLLVAFDPAEARQQVGDLAVHDVAAVELGRDADGQPQTAPGRLDERRIRRGAQHVAAELQERTQLARLHRFERRGDAIAFVARRLEAIELAQLVERRELGLSVMPTVRCPCTFEWPRTGQMPAPALPMLPRSSSRFTSICTFCVPPTCCVSPMP